MVFTEEFNILDFDFWGSAKWIQSPDLTLDQLDQLEFLICDVFSGSTPTSTQINDFVSFDLKDMIKEDKIFGENFDYSQF